MKFYFLALIILVSKVVTAQFGPGGVGNSANNGIWLSADQLLLNNNDPVSNWPDLSGNGNDANQTTVGRQPLFIQNSALNNKPAIRLDGNDDQLVISDADILDGSPGITYFVALRPNNLNSSARGILGKRITYTVSVEYAYTFFFYNSNYLTLDIHTQNNRFGTSPTAYNNAVNYIQEFTFDGTLPASQRSKIYTDGALVSTNTESSNAIPNSNQDVCIGALNVNYGTYLGADYSEVIQYNYCLNDAERIIVENYLSSKYNIAVAQDYFDFDVSYGNMVCGIGRIDPANFHDDAQGKSIVRINTPSSLDNGDYMLWGHNNASLADSNTTDVDQVLIESRMERVWRVDETGDVGNVSVAFDVSGFSPLVGSNLRLLIDRDGDGFFDNDIPPQAGTFAGGVITFNNVDFQYGDYFTLGSINEINTPLPVTFINFEATLNEKGEAELEWNVSAEINAHHYSIYKSNNGQVWKPLEEVSCENKNTYKSLDRSPFMGISYYKLTQTDHDGTEHFLSIKSIDRNAEKVKLFPNPAKDRVEIIAPQNIQHILVYNNLGQLVYDFNQGLISNKTIVDCSNFSKGIYHFKIQTESAIYTEKVILQ